MLCARLRVVFGKVERSIQISSREKLHVISSHPLITNTVSGAISACAEQGHAGAWSCCWRELTANERAQGRRPCCGTEGDMLACVHIETTRRARRSSIPTDLGLPPPAPSQQQMAPLCVDHKPLCDLWANAIACSLGIFTPAECCIARLDCAEFFRLTTPIAVTGT